MKRIFCIIVLVLMFAGEMFSQDKTYFGIKGGINIPRLYYSDSELSSLPHDFKIKPSLGVFLEFPLSSKLSLATELNYQVRGGGTSYVYEQDYDVTYNVNANYLSLRLPFYWYLAKKKAVSPYLMLGPDVGYVIGGEISLSQPGLENEAISVAINDSNYNPLYIGVLAGVGLRHKAELRNYICIVKLDVAVNWSLLDTFSQAEHDDTAVPVNIHAYNDQGKRYSRGLEVSLSFGLIRNEDMSACRKFK